MSLRHRIGAINRRLGALDMYWGDKCSDCGRKLLPATDSPEFPLFLRGLLLAKATQRRAGYGLARFAVEYCHCLPSIRELFKPSRTEPRSGTNATC